LFFARILLTFYALRYLVERAGFEPAKVKPPDLQSGPVGRLGNLSFDEEVIIFNPRLKCQVLD
jgi:hypothetical protein